MDTESGRSQGRPGGDAELGPAVSAALEWLGATPETAGALLGINSRTLTAMCNGIVPMRSLVIRFATELGRQCQGAGRPSPPWWSDIDAWLRLAGYEPRRDGPAPPSGTPAPGPLPGRQGTASVNSSAPLPAMRPPATGGRPPAALSSAAASESGPESAPPTEPMAGETYRPTYERKLFGDRMVHVFRILDRQDRRSFEINLPAAVDYKARAAQLKQDLASLSRSQFERKYGRFRVQE